MHLGAARGHGEEGGGLAFPFPQVDGHVGDRNGGGELLKVRPWCCFFSSGRKADRRVQRKERGFGERETAAVERWG